MINENHLFEEGLIHDYEKNPNPELAEILIKEYSSHLIQNTTPSQNLETWINKRSVMAKRDKVETADIFGLSGHGSRPGMEPAYICINAFCWEHILDGSDISSAFTNTALLFKVDESLVRMSFERKNHDFGERELCRVGLDLSIAISKRELSSTQIKLAQKILNEDIRIQMMKNLNHHRAKFNCSR